MRLLNAVRNVARKRGHYSRCPACSKPILIEDTVMQYRGKAHHKTCVVYVAKSRT